MQPNRIAALGGTASAVLAVLLAVLGAVDSTPKAIVVSVALVAVAGVAVVFMLGSQRWDWLQVWRDRPPGAPVSTPTVTVNTTSLADPEAIRGAIQATGPRSDPSAGEKFMVEQVDDGYLHEDVPEDAA